MDLIYLVYNLVSFTNMLPWGENDNRSVLDEKLHLKSLSNFSSC